MNRTIEIAPSVLPCDYGILGEELRRLEEAGAHKIQWDVMDGIFVPNLTFGADVIKSARSYTSLPFEVHLMIVNPEETIERYVDAGCNMVIIHAESTRHLDRTLHAVRALGARVAVALNPTTPEEAIRYALDAVDMVLVMTVNPGFGGQPYIAGMEAKVTAIRRMITERGLDIDIEVDGGISPATIAGAARSGANHFVAGSALYASPRPRREAVMELVEIATKEYESGEIDRRIA